MKTKPLAPGESSVQLCLQLRGWLRQNVIIHVEAGDECCVKACFVVDVHNAVAAFVVMLFVMVKGVHIITQH